MRVILAILVALLIAIIALAVWYFGLKWPFREEATAILVTGVLAAAVAVWALYSQRSIARRQCTIEHIAKSETDGDLIRGRQKFREITGQHGKMTELAKPEHEGSEEFQAVTTRLNEFELISIGIQRGIIDYELYSLWFKSGTQRAWAESADFIKALRHRHHNNMLFYEFEKLNEWLEKGSRPPRSRWWGLLF